MTALRAVLVGCGSMSGVWLRCAAQVEGLAVVGLVDLDRARAEGRREESGLAAAVFDDLEAALRDLRPELVFDCTVPEAHHGVVLAALRYGCHVLGEKPLADSMERAREMVAAAERAGRLYAVVQNRRYDPRIRRVRRLVESGVLGPLTILDGDFYLGAHFGGFRERMRHVLLLDMAIHSFDQARFLSGADAVSVWCRDWNPEGSWFDHGAAAVAVFEMTGGVVYTYRGCWCAEGLSTTWECSWRLVGTRGSAQWDGGDGFRAERVRDGAPAAFRRETESVDLPPEHADDRRDGHLGLLREFVECVRTGRRPETDCRDNLRSLAMVFAAIESAETGRVVALD